QPGTNEGLCLKCAREMNIRPVTDMLDKMGLSDDDLEGLTNEMMNAMDGMEGLLGQNQDDDQNEDDDEDMSRTATFPFLNKLFGGMQLSDTQTGLRAFPIDILEQMVKTKGDRYEYETQMLLNFKSLKIPYAEEKIRTVYIEENQTSHFRVVKDSFRIYKMIFAHFFKYLITSFASYLLELAIVSGLTLLINTTVKWDLTFTTAVAYVGARVLSSLFNFFMNQKFVFDAKCSMKKSLWKYYALCIPLAIAGLIINMLFVEGAVWLDFLPTGVERYVNIIIHPLVQIIMFLFTFAVQREWVYKTDSKHKLKRKKQDEQ
ncbi:MAG: GtrA family protein, partial [Clostridia bacterium]|nr:GtrA family protein [Clostridia bacterium]